jgi:hypothetical protein
MDVQYRKAFTWVFYIAAACLYLLLPTQNHSIDAWGYAGNVKWGNDLFAPHHLLYTVTGWLWVKVFHLIAPSAGVMSLLLAMNAIAGMLCILVLHSILKKLGRNDWETLGLMGMAAFSFGFWRFTTENETYILPILFSLLGSYYFIRYWKSGQSKYALLSGLFAAIACLYHQIHIFWWIGLFVGFLTSEPKRFQAAIIYALPFLVVPAGYIIVLTGYFNQPVTFSSLWHFVMHDVYSGGAGYAIGAKHFLLGGVNLVRTFFQVHGIIAVLVKKSIFWFAILPGLLTLLFIFRATWKVRFAWSKDERKTIFHIHLLIFILQFLFAIYNVGNAEFMAMLPALLVICLACFEKVPSRGTLNYTLVLFIWNIWFGIAPTHSLSLSADKQIAESAEAKEFLIASEHGIISNYIYYKEGEYPNSLLKPPSYYVARNKPLDSLAQAIDTRLSQNLPVYTDCTGRPPVVNRASLMNAEADRTFFQKYDLIPVREFSTDIGMHSLFRVREKE